jgi:hypothetical protein
MTRKGKIARLPHPIREQINLRLQNGEMAIHIAQWLNSLPEVTVMLAAEFDGQPINQINLCHWKLGGYRDWQAQQEALQAVHRFGADAAEISNATGDKLADQLAVCLMARIAVALQKPGPEGEDPVAQLQRLRLLFADFVALRKADHNAQWLRLEREKLDLRFKKGKAEEAARQREIENLKNPQNGGVPTEVLDWVKEEFKIV